MSWYLSSVKYFAYGYISVLFIRIHPSGLCTPTTHSFVFAFAMPKEQQQRSSVSTVTVNHDSDAAISPSINHLIQSFADYRRSSVRFRQAVFGGKWFHCRASR